MNTMEREVFETVRAFNRAFAANDPETYFTFVDDGITLLLPSCPYRVDGKADDREEFEFGLGRGWTRVGYFQEMQPKVQLHGDVAVVTYFSRGSYGEGANEKVRCYKETDIWVKRPDGWKVVHIHLSPAA